MGKKKMRKKGGNWKRITFLFVSGILALIITLTLILVITNLITRERFELNEVQREALLTIFPEEYLNTITIYKGGIPATFSSMTVCKSIYIKTGPIEKFTENQNSPGRLSVLVHEVTHTWQNRGSCVPALIQDLFGSLIPQFVGFLKSGSRSEAYSYSLNNSVEDLNLEQEASIVEDYYYIAFSTAEDLHVPLCRDCGSYDKKTLSNLLANKSQEILVSYT